MPGRPASGVVASSVSERGEVVLRRRRVDDALELRVNGVFVMDTRETSTERLLAKSTLDAVAPTAGRGLSTLIGGLGLGFTLAEVLADGRVDRVTVGEIEPCLVAWHRDGVVTANLGVVTDPRVQVEVGDVRDVVARQPRGSIDVVLLDVDNGPGFLVYDDNAAVYRAEFLRICRDATRPRGITAIWSCAASAALARTMQAVFGRVDEVVVPVRLGRRQTTYHLFLGHREAPTLTPCQGR